MVELGHVTMGCYPRDDVSWAKDGKIRQGRATVYVRQADGNLKRIDKIIPDDFNPIHVDAEVGAEIIVDLRARFESETFYRRVTFIITDDEDDLCISAIGPGAHAEPKAGFLRRRRYSGFEFGVLVMAATTEQGTPITSPRGPLVEHGPNDGVGAAYRGPIPGRDEK